MNRVLRATRPIATLLAMLAILLISPRDAAASKLQPQTLRAWETYVQLTERRIERELGGTRSLLAMDIMTPADGPKVRTLLKSGQVHIQKMKTLDVNGREIKIEDGLIHHWFGSIFIPNVRMQRVVSWVQDYDQHSRYFTEVEKSKLVSREGDTFKIFLRVMRKKIVTVHYNTEHTVTYRQHDDGVTSAASFTTRIAELDNAGSASEKEMPVGVDSGYFWRLNSYWRFREAEGGVFLECESISLSRSIPFGIGWLIKGFVESVPRESLESTLTQIRDGIGK